MSRTGKLCQTAMDTFGFKRGCKDYMGSGREGAMRSLCCSMWKDAYLSPPLSPQTEVRKGPSGAFTSFHPATSVSSASWAHQQCFGTSFPVSPSTSSIHLNVSCVKCSPKTLNPSFLCSVISGVIPKQKATVNCSTTVPSCIISKRLTQPERKSRALHGFL